MNLVKRQHYVWRHYLRSWTTNDKIWCNRMGKIFNAGLMAVGQERYFYEIATLNNAEFDFLKKLVRNPHRPETQPLMDMIVEFFHVPTQTEHLLQKFKISDKEGWDLHREAKVNAHEKIHCSVEESSIAALEAIHQRNASYFDDEEHMAIFVQYLCFQYLRTKKMRDIYEAMDFDLPYLKDGTVDKDKLWGPLSVANAYQLALGILNWPKKHHVKILDNQTTIPFITGDQPVINSCTVGKPRAEEAKDLEFFHPIGPMVAIKLGHSIVGGHSVERVVDENEIRSYNKLMAAEAHEQIYGKEETCVNSIRTW